MKILGIGNALVDILVKLPNDELLKELNIAKGSMNLIEQEMRNSLFEKLKTSELAMTSGGSVSNTSLALKQLGAPAGYIGKVGNDEYGKFYVDELTKAGVEPHLIHEPAFSGTAIVLITPDGERTFCTYLGSAARMQKAEIQKTTLEQYTHLYVEGYLVQNHDLIEGVMTTAKSLGMKIMFDFSSFNVVAADRVFIRKLVRDYVDIVFANEEEAYAFTGKSSAGEAIHEMATDVEIAVLKEGDKGSRIKRGGELIQTPPYQKIKPLDTTAAGDYYAAGFFYGMIKQASLEQCAQLGSLLACYIIRVVGTKLPPETWSEIREKALKILNAE
ncbi:MAG: adenosine kinase [Dysgonamonadaceae bacterium]|jgi:sugar/nucleoside kinase (ribokinase family)|nr:adenosine kinase [Dysgonamonadaceae bacterium]